jgi:hypothetical protein
MSLAAELDCRRDPTSAGWVFMMTVTPVYLQGEYFPRYAAKKDHHQSSTLTLGDLFFFSCP